MSSLPSSPIGCLRLFCILALYIDIYMYTCKMNLSHLSYCYTHTHTKSKRTSFGFATRSKKVPNGLDLFLILFFLKVWLLTKFLAFPCPGLRPLRPKTKKSQCWTGQLLSISLRPDPGILEGFLLLGEALAASPELGAQPFRFQWVSHLF